jgi:hypothetical protein
VFGSKCNHLQQEDQSSYRDIMQQPYHQLARHKWLAANTTSMFSLSMALILSSMRSALLCGEGTSTLNHIQRTSFFGSPMDGTSKVAALTDLARLGQPLILRTAYDNDLDEFEDSMSRCCGI